MCVKVDSMNVIYRTTRLFGLMTGCVLAAGLAVGASAQTVLVDFGSDTSYRGLTATKPDSKGNYWNSLQPGVPGVNMIDLHNAATTLDLYFDTPVATDSYNGPAGPTEPVPPAFPHYWDFLPFTDIDADALGNMGGSLEAAFDYAASPGGADNRTRFQIQELDPTKKYDLSFFGSHSYSTDTETKYTVYTDNTYTTSVATANLKVQDATDPSLHNRDTIVTLSNLSPQASNIFYVEFVGANGNLGYLNELRIVASASAPSLVGDYNNNGKVDAADYVIWRNNVGTTTVLPNDPTGGTIGTAQYNAWRSHFGTTLGSGLGAGAAVPEPTTLCMALFTAVLSGLMVRRR